MIHLFIIILMTGQLISWEIGPGKKEQDVTTTSHKPKILRYVKPAFPDNSPFKNLTETVVVNVLIDTNGRVSDMEFRESLPPELENVIRETIKSFVFEPGRDSLGNPVKVWFTISIPISDMENEVPDPEFPPEADSCGLDSGEVVIDLEVAPDGSVIEARVRKSTSWVFESAALNAAMKARFKPSSDNRWFTIIYQFKKGANR